MNGGGIGNPRPKKHWPKCFHKTRFWLAKNWPIGFQGELRSDSWSSTPIPFGGPLWISRIPSEDPLLTERSESEILRNWYHQSIPRPRIPTVDPYEFQGFPQKTLPWWRKLSLKFWETDTTNRFRFLNFPSQDLQRLRICVLKPDVSLTSTNKQTNRQTDRRTNFFSARPSLQSREWLLPLNVQLTSIVRSAATFSQHSFSCCPYRKSSKNEFCRKINF
jgi:hypothetical protein